MEPDSQSKDGDSKTYKRIFSDNSLSGKLQKRLASGQRNYSCPPFSNMISLYRKCFFEIGSDPALKERIGIVIELKYAADSNLEAACREALNQIEEKKYAEELRRRNMKKIMKYGIAFCRKECKVVLAFFPAEGSFSLLFFSIL